MPKELTHLSFAEEVKKNLPENIRKDIESNLDFFRLGAIAPDASFYSKDRKINNISDYIHGENGNLTNEIIFDLLDPLKNTYSSERFSFVCGLITHFCLDMVFHPVVYYFSGNYFDSDEKKREEVRYLHRHLETALAKRELEKQNLNSLEKVKIENIGYDAYLAEKFGVSKKAIEDSFERQFRANRKFRSVIFYNLFFILNKFGLVKKNLLGLFFPNIKKDQRVILETFNYCNPLSGESFSGSIRGLFLEARLLSAERIKAATDFSHQKIDLENCRKIILGENLSVKIEKAETKKSKFFAPL